MPVKKIAISVPEDVLQQVDRLAQRAKTTRSALISQVLKEVSHARNKAEITERINQLFEDPEITKEQRESSREFLRAAEPEDGDQEW